MDKIRLLIEKYYHRLRGDLLITVLVGDQACYTFYARDVYTDGLKWMADDILSGLPIELKPLLPIGDIQVTITAA